jgi:hypothetical protein
MINRLYCTHEWETSSQYQVFISDSSVVFVKLKYYIMVLSSLT